MAIGGDIGVLIAGALTLVLTAIALILALFALATRSLFVACVLCMVITALASAALTADHATLPAIAIACLGGALFPVLVLGGMLLSTSSTRSRRGSAPWLTALAALATAALILAVAPELALTMSARPNPPDGYVALLAALIFVAGATALALIGYGERGALESRHGGRS